MKKRIFALIMAMCLALSLLPASVFAENESGSDVVYGTYGTGTTWTQDKKGTGTIEYKTGDGNTITLSKKATPLGDNTYRIDLEVKTTQTTTTTPPGAAATVLVLDTSGSMDYCAECGQKNYHASGCEHYQEPDWDNWFPDNSVKTEETRLAAAKTAATNFLDSYKGDTAGVGRYVSLVSFAGSASVKCDWQDVSTTAGYNAVVRAIRSLSANGGTNLDAGLKNAANQFTKSAVSGISKDSRNVIALTDGAPTKSASHGNGTNGSWAINNETANTAATLRTAASVYTVCFGAAGQDTYPGGSTVDVFLEKNIATPATADTKYAYNAADSSELNAAFKAITTSITTGISSGTVADPMGPNISVKEKPEAFRTEDGKAYTWELANGVKSTDGSKTTYTYQLSYKVKLDTTGEGFKENDYYPTNGKTTFTSGDKTFEFPVPGVKGTIPSYQVKYEYKGDVPTGALAQLPADETHKMHTDVTVAAEPKLDGYVFSGWTTTDAAVSSDGQFKMPGQNVTLTGSWTLCSDLSYTVNYYWNGTTDKVAPSKTVGGQTFNAAVTESPIDVAGYTPVSTDSENLTIGTGKNVINFYYYQNVTLTANSGTTFYDGEEHSVSGFTSAPDGADFSAVTVGAKGTNVGTYPAQFQEGTVGTVDATEKYIVAEAKDGKLTITPVGGIVVTITGITDSRPYSGAEQFVTGYTVSTSNPLYTEADFTFTGTATAKGTDAGTYMMGLTPAQFENTNPNFENVTFSVTDGALTITPRSVKLTSETAEKVYDGMPLTRPDVAITGDGFVAGEVSAIRATGTVTNVSDGEQPNTIVYTTSAGFKPGNYSIEKDEGTLKITPVTDKVTVTITGNDGSVGYDGNEHSVTGYKVESISNPLYTAADFAFSGTDSVTGTDAGTYMMGLTPAQFENTNPNFENVTFSVTDGALTITPMPLTITAGSDSKAYNGTPLTNDTFTRTSLAAGDTLASVTVTGSQTDVGSSKNVASDAKLMRGDRDVTANYAIDYLPGTLTVTKNESAKLTAEAYKGVYDGGEHDAVVKTALSDLVDDSVWTYSYSLDGEHYTDEMPQVKNVGTYPVWVKATNDNYVDLVTVVTAEVTPATILVTADSHEWIIAVKDTCVGDPEPALTYQAESPVAGETPAFSGELSREPGAERGKTYQILQGDLALADGENFLASNYVLQFVPGELTVKARDITITKTVDVTKAFVGDKLTYTITVTNTGDVDLQDVAVVDEMLGIEQVIGELKAGESWTQQFTYTAQESDAGKTLVNTAVTGTKDEKTLDQVDSDGTEITQKPVPTGDQSMVGLWTATLLISAAGAAIILARKSRRSK